MNSQTSVKLLRAFAYCSGYSEQTDEQIETLWKRGILASPAYDKLAWEVKRMSNLIDMYLNSVDDPRTPDSFISIYLDRAFNLGDHIDALTQFIIDCIHEHQIAIRNTPKIRTMKAAREIQRNAVALSQLKTAYSEIVCSALNPNDFDYVA